MAQKDSLANYYIMLAEESKKKSNPDSAVFYYKQAILKFEKVGEI